MASLDEWLALSPIPIIGEISAYRVEKERNGYNKATTNQNQENARDLAVLLSITKRGIVYMMTAGIAQSIAYYMNPY